MTRLILTSVEQVSTAMQLHNNLIELSFHWFNNVKKNILIVQQSQRESESDYQTVFFAFEGGELKRIQLTLFDSDLVKVDLGLVYRRLLLSS